MILSERMAELRKEKNLSQAELADALNVSRQSVSLLGERRGRSRLIFFWLYFALHFGVYTEFGTDGGADKILDYADRPSFCLYSSGLSPPRDILICFSRYQTI